MITFFIRLFIWWKYRSFKFKEEGANCSYKGIKAVFTYPENITLASNIQLGSGVELHGLGGISIGRGVIFAPDVCIYSLTHNFDSENLSALPFDNQTLLGEVIIKDYVWIGRQAMVLPGVTIGKAAVIGARSVVAKDVPDYAVVVGNPAVIVRYRNKERVEDLIAETEPYVILKYKHKKVLKIKNVVR